MGGKRRILAAMVLSILLLNLATCCFMCSPRFTKPIREFIEDVQEIDPGGSIELDEIFTAAKDKLKEVVNAHSGIILRTTLDELLTLFEARWQSFLESNYTGETLISKFKTFLMDETSELLDRNMDRGLCRGPCQHVMKCRDCRKERLTCSFDLNCGQHSIQAEQGSAALLNCSVGFHGVVEGKLSYHYRYHRRNGTQSDNVTLLVSEQPSMLLTDLTEAHQGL